MKVKPITPATKESLFQTKLYVEEVKRRKLPGFIIKEKEYQVGLGEKLRSIRKPNDSRSIANSKSKFDVSEILESCGTPVPKHTLLKKKERKQYRKLIKNLRLPLVVKPVTKSRCVGITLGLKKHDELKKAVSLAFKYGNEVIIEEFIPDLLDYRLTFFKGEYLGAVLAVPEVVIGDGKSKVTELIKEYNRFRKSKYDLPPLTHDWVFKTFLAQYGYSLNSVPRKGEEIRIYGRGGIYKNVSKEVHEDNIELCRNACQVLGLEFAGVDFMSKDASIKYSRNGAVINEVNSYPHVTLYRDIIIGEKLNLPKRILRIAFPSDGSAWIPITRRGKAIKDFVELRKHLRKKPKEVTLKEPKRKLKTPKLPLLNYLLNNKVARIKL